MVRDGGFELVRCPGGDETWCTFPECGHPQLDPFHPDRGMIVMRCPRCQTYMWKVTPTDKWKCLSCLWPDEEKK